MTTYRAAAFIVLAVSAAACGGTPDAPRVEAGPAVRVEVATARTSDRADVLAAGGTLHGQRSAVVASRLMSTVIAVHVAPGDRVRAGQSLVQLDDAAMAADARSAAAGSAGAARGVERARAEAAAATAAASLARSTHARIQTLHGRRSATPQELDEAVGALAAAEARVTAAAAAVAEAEAGIARAEAGGEAATAVAAYARLVAPFDGVVTEKMVEPGDLVAPGSPLVRIEDTRGFEFDLRVDDSRSSWARIGSTVPVIIDGDEGTVTREGRITEVGRAASVDGRAVAVTVRVLSADGLRSGMFGRVMLPGTTRAAIAVPATAIVRRGQLTSVFVIDNGTARMRIVRLGVTAGLDVEIAAGLSDGEQFVVVPPATLRDGSPVQTSGVSDAAGADGNRAGGQS